MTDETLPGAEPPEPAEPELDPTLVDRIAQRLFGDTKPEPLMIGRFEIESTIGAGGMGEVLLARDPLFDRRVALKRMLAQEGQSRGALGSEARALAQLQHPHVVAVYELLEVEGKVHLVMEYVAGTTLARWQALQPRARVLDAYEQAARGLAAVHRAGLVHRDFKPANVLVGSDLRVRVADFGLATMISTDGASAGPLSGTPEYMAPELFAGRPPTPRSDQFSFCVALWEAITRQRPPVGDSGMPTQHGFAGPRWLGRILMRGLASDPAERWPDMDTLLRQLERGPKTERRFAMGGVVLAAMVGAQMLAPTPTPCDDDLWSIEQWHRFGAALQSAELDERPALRSSIDALVASDTALEQQRAALCSSEPDALAHAQLTCLDRMSKRSIALRERLLAADLVDVPALLEALPTLELCQAEAPSGPSERSVRVMSLRQALERGFQAYASGQLVAAASIADSTLSLGDLPTALRVDALLLRARAERRLGQTSQARLALIEVLKIAEASVPARVQAACELAELEAFVDEGAAAELPLELARAGASSLQLPSLELEVLLASAEVERMRKPERAIPLLEAAMRSVESGNPAQRARVRLRLVNAEADAELYDAAIRDYGLLIEDARTRFGPSHPSLATLELNLGLTFADAERWLEAREHLGRAVEIETHWLGDASPTLAPMLAKLAEAEVELGACVAGEQLARRAYACQNDGDPAAMHALASALLCQRRYEALDEVYQALLDEPTRDPEERDALLQTAAWTACRLGQFERAAALVSQTSTDEPNLALRIDEVEIEIALARGDVDTAARLLLDGEARMRALPSDAALAAEFAWLRVRVGRAANWPDQATDLAAALRDVELLAPDQKIELQ